MDTYARSTPRRWFRIRLITVIVLVGILSWAMAINAHFGAWHHSTGPLPGRFLNPEHEPVKWQFEVHFASTREYRSHTFGITFNSALKWPVLALMALISWRAVSNYRANRVPRVVRPEKPIREAGKD